MRCLLRGRLGASVVMHDAGHRHDTSALQDLWAAAIEEDEADPCRIPGPGDHDDCMHDPPAYSTAGHQDTRVGV
jgi:hypothetical protein